MCTSLGLGSSGDEDTSFNTRDISPLTIDPSKLSKFKPAILLISNVDTTIRDIDMYFMLQKYGVIRNIASHPASFNFFHRISVKFEREVDAYNVMEKIQGMDLRGMAIEVEMITSQIAGDLQERLKTRLNQMSVDDYSDEACALPSSSSSSASY